MSILKNIYLRQNYYSYINVNEVSEKTIPPPSEDMTINFAPQSQLSISLKGEHYELNEELYELYPYLEEATSDDIPTLFTQFFNNTDLEESAYVSTDFSGSVDITFPMSTGDYSFQAPSHWGMRKSPGEIQIALIELIKAEADLLLALPQYSGLMGEISYKIKILQGRSDLNKSELDIARKWKSQTEDFLTTMVTLRNVADVSETLGGHIQDHYNAAAEALPKVIGMSTDVNSAPRAALEEAGVLASQISSGIALATRAAADGVETEKELAQFDVRW